MAPKTLRAGRDGHLGTREGGEGEGADGGGAAPGHHQGDGSGRNELGGKLRPGLQGKPQLGVLAAGTWHLRHRRAGPVGEVRAG